MAGLRLDLLNDLSEIGRMAEAVELFCEEAGLGPAETHALALSLDELATNALSYGYAPGAEGRITLTVEIAGGCVTALLVDDGRPFDPTAAEAPDLDAELDDRPIGGLGLHLAAAMMDEIRYERAEGRNRTTLVKRLPAPGDD